MSLEGRIRELGLHEVCQLLALSRKSGTLRIRAPLHGVAADIVLTHGVIVDAAAWSTEHAAGGERPDPTPPVAADARRIEACVLELLTWTDGEFRFLTGDAAASPSSPVRIAMEPVLVEAAQRAATWERVADRVPNARAVPAFVDVESQQLPLLRLEPQEWEILTRVDGQRDLRELAAVLQRDLLDVVQLVHGLIGAGLLVLRDGAREPRRHDTPPTQLAISQFAADETRASAALDLWIPDDESDAVFDPVRAGVFTPEGLPRLRTPLAAPGIITPALRDDRRRASAHPTAPYPSQCTRASVASHPDEPSLLRGEEAAAMAGGDAGVLCRRGDEAARRGDLASALEYWSSALRSDTLPVNGSNGANADRIREAIALAARLHALLHPSLQHAPEN